MEAPVPCVDHPDSQVVGLAGLCFEVVESSLEIWSVDGWLQGIAQMSGARIDGESNEAGTVKRAHPGSVETDSGGWAKAGGSASRTTYRVALPAVMGAAVSPIGPADVLNRMLPAPHAAVGKGCPLDWQSRDEAQKLKRATVIEQNNPGRISPLKEQR